MLPAFLFACVRKCKYMPLAVAALVAAAAAVEAAVAAARVLAVVVAAVAAARVLAGCKCRPSLLGGSRRFATCAKHDCHSSP